MYVMVAELIKEHKTQPSDIYEMLTQKYIKNIFISYASGEMKKMEDFENMLEWWKKTELEEINEFYAITKGMIKNYSEKCRAEYDKMKEDLSRSPRAKGSEEAARQYFREILEKDIKSLKKDCGPHNPYKAASWRSDKEKYLRRKKELENKDLLFREVVKGPLALYRLEYEDAAKKFVMNRIKAK